MQKQVSFQIHRLLDTDYVEGVPYVQIKPESGVDWSADTKAHKSSGTGIRKKDDSFEWDADVSECVLTFVLDENCTIHDFEAVVSIYFDNDGDISRYDGVGRIEHLESDAVEDAICTLYDNGDEDLPSFGEIIYSYHIEDVEDAEDVADEKDVDNDQKIDSNPDHWTVEFDNEHQCTYYYNHVTLESTWERPPCLSSLPTSTTQSTITALKSPQVRRTGSNQDTTGDFSSSGAPFGMNTTGSDLSTTLRTGSNTNSHPQHKQISRPPDDVSVSESKCSAAKQKKMRKKTPEWAKYGECSGDLNTIIKNDLADIKPEDCTFGIRVHSMMCSNTHEPLDMEAADGITSGQLKISIQPFPGKGHVLKTKVCDVDSEGMLNFDFNLQTVNLGMGQADLKSKAFLNGVCPHILVEFSCMGSITKGCLYLPEVLHIEENHLVWVNMLPQESKNADGSSRVNIDTIMKSTLILEVVKKSIQNTTATDSVSTTQSSRKKLHLKTAGLIAANVCVDIGGIAALSKLKLNYDKCILEASLSCSGQHSFFPIEGKSAFKEGVSINTSFSFISDFPKLDILFLKVFEVGDATLLLGAIEIPVYSLISSSETSGCLSGPFKSFCVERPPMSKSGVILNKFHSNDWALICSIQCSALEDEGRESPVTNYLAHTLTTLDENDELADTFEPQGPEKNSHIEKRQFETVNSVDGSLHVCVHGFIPKQGSAGPSLTKSDMLSVEFSLPNAMHSLKEKTEMVRVCSTSEGTDQSSLCSMWEKEFSFPVVWAVQQRHVGFLQGCVYRSSSVEGAKMRRQLLGYITVDIASMVNLHGDAIVCTLPVTTQLCGDEDYQNCNGYVMLGLQFNDNNAPVKISCPPPAPTNGSGIRIKPVRRPPLQQSKRAWGGDNQSIPVVSDNLPSPQGRGKLNQQMSPLPLPQSAFSDVKKACMNLWPQYCSDVITSFSNKCDGNPNDTTPSDDISGVSVSLSSVEVVGGPLRNIHDEEQIALHMSSNEDGVLSRGGVDPNSGKICLDDGDLIMPVNMKRNNSILLLMKLSKVDDDEVLGVATLIIPRKIVITGKPMNIAVPMRDANGLKIAVVICGLHFSSLGQSSLEEPEEESETGSQLQVCVVEGNIVDALWTSSLEPYFECSLSKAVHSGLPIQSAPVNHVETSSVDINSPGNWNATCSVPLPREAVVDPVTTKQGSTPLWSLLIICRDAARRECPEICRSQMNIPWSLISAGKPVEQWVELIPSSNGTSLVEDYEDGDVEEKPVSNSSPTTRLRLQISKVDILKKAKDTPFQGVGHIVMWFHSIREGESQREKVFPAMDILAAEASVQSIDNCHDYYEDDSNKESMFSNIHIETRQSIFVANKTADVLCGSVAVPGGHSINHLRITARHEKVALLASFPTLATLPKSTSDSNLSLDVPLHEAVLRPNIKDNFVAGATKQRMSRIKLGAVFVPFVVGTLQVEHSHLELFDTVADKFQMSPTKNGALRYSLGGVGSCFTSEFSMSIHEDGTSTVCSNLGNGGENASVISQLSNYPGQPKAPGRGKKSSLFKRPGSKVKGKNAKTSSKLRSIVAENKEVIRDPQYIFVDTFELLTQAANGKNSSADIFDLTVNLIDLDAVGGDYCMGSGQIKTSPIYFQALRILLSAPQNDTSSGPDCAPSTLASEVKIFDKNKRVLIGTVHITLKFDISSVPLPIINALKSFKNTLFAAPAASGGSGLDGLGRAELGLKQAYQLADKDQSGGINMTELTSVLESISSMKKKKSKEIVGLDEGAIALLVGLMGLINGAKANGDVDYNHDEILKLFQVMDLDGDGNVSWWEWKQVLEGGFAVMLMNSEQQLKAERATDSQHIYPLDPLLVTLEAAHASLMAKYGGRIRKRLDLPKSNSTIPKSVQLSSSDQLKDKIAKMKAKNSRLQLKLEAAQNTSDSLVSPQKGQESDVYRSVKADEQAKQARELLEIERKRRTELEIELEKMQHNSEEITRSRSIQNSTNQHSLQQLHAESDKLRQQMVVAHLSRRKKDKSALIIQRFFFMIHDKYVEGKELQERNRLRNGMESLILRRRYRNMQAERASQAIKIQCLYRKFSARNRMRILWKAVHKIHELYYMRKLRKAAGREREILQEKLFIRRLEEAAAEKKKLEEEDRKKQEAAATDIQLLYRNHACRLKEKKENAAVGIQAMFRGHAHRKSMVQRSSSPLDEASALEDGDNQMLDDLSLSKDELMADEMSVFHNLAREIADKEMEDPDAVMILRSAPRPNIENAVGYWVSHPPDGDDFHPESETSIVEREAQVEAVDLDSQRMTVAYHMEDPSSENYFQYDDPNLTWLKSCSEREIELEIKATTRIQAAFRGREERKRFKKIKNAQREEALRKKKASDELNASTKIQACFRGKQGRKIAEAKKLSAMEEDTVLTDGLEEVERPSPNDVPGYWIKIPSDHQEGLVDRIDPHTGVMKVMYDVDEDGDGIADGSEERDVDYSNPDLVWLKEKEDNGDIESTSSVETDGLSVVERPPFEDATGYWVKIPHDHQEGLVDKIDLNSGLMKVMYDIDEDGDGVADDSEIREIEYSKSDLIWMKERDETDTPPSVSPEKLNESASDDDDVNYVEIDKPAMESAAGSWIKIGVDGEEGLVDKIDMKTGMMRILYDTDSVNEDHVLNLEEDYNNPEIIWLKYDFPAD